MLIKSATMTQMSGSVGGITGSHNRGGLYFRARSIPVNPNTTPQQEARSALASLVSGWSTLTQAQRDGWAVYSTNVPLVGPLGDPRNVGALGMYVRSNVPRITASQRAFAGGPLPQVDDAPTTFDLGSFTPVSLTINGTTGIASIAFTVADAWVSEDDAALLVQWGQPVNPGRAFFGSPFRYSITPWILGQVAIPPTSPQTFVPAFPAVTGQRQFCRVRVSRADGRLSAAQTLSAIAT